MSEPKPLHVQVAEALGWTIEPRCSLGCGKPPGGTAPNSFTLCSGRDGTYELPRYDTDWAATGPLIEKIVERHGSEWLNKHAGYWARDAGCSSPTGYGKTLLEAVCHQILKLHKAGLFQ